MDDARARARWWRLEGFEQLRHLLWQHWDPLGLGTDLDAPRDEYESYEPLIADKLQRGDRADLVAYLTDALNTEEVASQAWRAQCETTAEVLVDWYRRATTPA